MQTVSAGSYCSQMEVLEGRKRSGSVLAEAKYKGQSQQETKIGGLVSILW